ncbi:MAG: extracellular solute-binding protein [Planctomycetota bacterium]|jgi:iron(III) transport system substrate-binding protein
MDLRIMARMATVVLIAAQLPVVAQDDAAGASKGASVTVYCSIDEPFGRMVLDEFKRETGIDVRVEFDTEAGKSTGLFNKIMSESRSGRPRADVFWSSELFNTIILARNDMLLPYDSPSAADIPARYRDDKSRWTALAVRGRVLAYDPASANPEGNVSWESIGQSRLAQYTVMANPLFGTTRGHVAAMFALWGNKRAKVFLKGFRDNGGKIVDGNSMAVREVIAGRRPFAMTDTDDVWVAREQGHQVDLVYPDMGDGGTLLVPCSVALIKGRPANANARKLVDFLVSARVEEMLAQSTSRNIPVREALRNRLNLQKPPETKVSFDAVADAMEVAMAAVREILLQ